MKFPKYWAKGRYATVDADNVPVSFECWHWSDASVQDARTQAERRAQMVATKFVAGGAMNRYNYGERPIREEVVEAIPVGAREVGLITRNAYGALVLNAAQAMFIDIDFPEGASSGSGLLGGLFGKKPAAPEAAILPNIEQWIHRYPGLGIRVYRTAGGLRCLVTTDTFDPANPSTLDMMKALGADPLYVTLCRQQESFRARLTPKPWRCDIDPPPSRYPWESAQQEAQYRAWEAGYRQNSADFAVCRLVATYGGNRQHPDIAPIVTLHDRYCGVDANRTLA